MCVGNRLSCSHALICDPDSRVSSSVLPRWDAGPTLLSAAAGQWQGWFLTFVSPGPALSPATGIEGQSGEGVFPSPMPPHGRWVGQCQLCCSHTLRAGSPCVPDHCFPGEVHICDEGWGHLSSPLMGRASLPAAKSSKGQDPGSVKGGVSSAQHYSNNSCANRGHEH